MKIKTQIRTQQDRADETRKKIIHAAIREFSTQGLAGARTDAIAESAKVNKALLYYYFKSKSGLYTAALEEIAGKIVESALAALEPGRSAGERLLGSALNHFDRIFSQHEFQSLMQQEMVRIKRGESESMPILVRTVFKPLVQKLQETVQEGIRTGELCEMDWMQVVYAMLGANVFYFLSAPMMQLLVPVKLFGATAIAARRKSAVQFLGQALFVDRAHGAKLAKRVLADMPMPPIKNPKVRRKYS